MGAGQHLDRLGERAVTGDRAVVVAVGPDQIGQHLGIPPVGLGPGGAMAAAVATHRVRVNRIDLIASGHQGPDQQASVGLDPDRDLCWVLSVGGHQGVQFPHPTQPFGDPLTWHDIPPAVRPPQHQPGHGLPPRACGLRCLRVLTGWWLRRSLPSKTRAAPLGSLPSTPPPIRFLVADDRTSSSAAPAPGSGHPPRPPRSRRWVAPRAVGRLRGAALVRAPARVPARRAPG
jgi:hypothetical protein